MSAHPHDNPISADDALARLIDGNRRFLRGESRPAAGLESLASLALAQRPYATILGCSDSRVPPELLFDACLGELFVVRVAGNILSPEVAGSFQYAASHLGTPLFMVLGHTRKMRRGLRGRLGDQARWRPGLLADSDSARQHPAGASRVRSRAISQGATVAGRRGQRALDGSPGPRVAGGKGPHRGGPHEDRRRGLRNRDGPRPASRFGSRAVLKVRSRRGSIEVAGRGFGRDLGGWSTSVLRRQSNRDETSTHPCREAPCILRDRFRRIRLSPRRAGPSASPSAPSGVRAAVG